MLNVDKKPLCGARKQRWLVSVAWKEKKKIPATAAIHQQQQKKTSTTTTKKIKTIFQEGNFSACSLWRSSCDALTELCVFEGNFSLSLSLSFTRRWSLNEFVYVGKWNEKKIVEKIKTPEKESGKKSWEKRMSET